MAMPSGSGPAQAVRAVIGPVVDAAGLHLEDVVVAPAGRRSAVRIILDLGEDAVGSLDLDTLGEVSREISAVLDEKDPVRGQYVLEVSTPGTDRPLTELRHFRRARTRLVRLSLRDGTVVQGRLLAAGPDRYDVETEPGTVRTLDPADVARGVVEVELRRLADPAEDADDADAVHTDGEDEVDGGDDVDVDDGDDPDGADEREDV